MSGPASRSRMAVAEEEEEVEKKDLFFIADCFPLLEELNLTYPRTCCDKDFMVDDNDPLLALPNLRRINLSGVCIVNFGRTREKLQFAERVMVAIENTWDMIVQYARPYEQIYVLKFAQYTGARTFVGRHTSGTFTNQLQTSFCDPRLLILTDPRIDHQPIKKLALGIYWSVLKLTSILPPSLPLIKELKKRNALHTY
ncbi:unnamed protein product [Vicia faba]|uniref:Uncharacterized protein n=1 Tax=Vicia faba TaxID=3906 RepID=A0AAV0ZX28_VICFA|nr:unnamed protein product [Vicia faba]